ncbi:MAG: DNA-binding protein [bacterium]|nr:DNA-binding protein [bacterium]
MENHITKTDLLEFQASLISHFEKLIDRKMDTKTTTQTEYLKTKEVMSYLKIRSINTLNKVLIECNLTRTKIGGTFYYRKSEVQSLLENDHKTGK